MFEPGDYVVYGMKGVCQVEEITELDMKGTAEGRLYYVLRPFFQKGSTIFTPVDNEKTAMRAVMSRDEARKLVDEISEIERCWKKMIKNGNVSIRKRSAAAIPGSGYGLSRLLTFGVRRESLRGKRLL